MLTRTVLVAAIVILAGCGSRQAVSATGASTLTTSATTATTTTTAAASTTQSSSTSTTGTSLATTEPTAPTETTAPPGTSTTTTTEAPPPTTAAPGDSGVEGAVRVGPTQPVCQVDQPCDRPAEAEVEAVSRATGTVAGRTTSDSAGHYAMALAPGDYTVSARTSSAMRCSSVDVTVEAGRYATADIQCDTGIR